jgi:glycosyltransferase involved in cell wall biosynthesis
MFMTQLSPLVLRELYGTRTLLHVVNYDLICPLNTKVLPDGSTCRHRAGMVCFHEGCVGALGLARTLSQTKLRERWHDAFDVVVANSEWVRQRLRADGIEVAEVVWNGVAERPQRPPLADPPTITYSGRLVAKKGVDILVRAYASVLQTVPEARLLIAGDGPERSKLERLVRDLGLGRHVVFLGHLSQELLEPALAQSWVHAVPSLWEEPFGLTAAEAMMRGTAVVSSAVGGVAEIVRDGETGITVPSGDPEALAQALATVLSDRATAEQLGAAGRRRALSRLTESATLDRFEALYERLTSA